MKIALIQPKNPDFVFTPALGLLYIASILERDGFNVKIFDENYDPFYLNKVINFNPSLVGFTCVTPSINRALKTSERLKRYMPGVKILLGGAHVTLMAEELIRNPNVDFCIVREGEYPTLELVRAIANNKNNFNNIGNLIYKINGNIIRNKPFPFLSPSELDRLPYPAFNLLDLENVFSSVSHGLFSKGKRILPVIASRGCPNYCTFCCKIMGFNVRHRSCKSIIDEIGYLINRFNIDEVYFEDDNFTIDRDRAIEILDQIRINFPGLYIKFANGLRADEVDEQILKKIKDAGGYWVGFGIESGSEGTLKMMKKNLNLELAKRNISIAKKLGFKVGSNCIIGYPEETIGDIKESVEFFKKLNLDSFAIVNLVPFPGTEVYALCKRKGYLTKTAEDYDNYNFKLFNVNSLINTPMLNEKELKRFVRLAYFKLYLFSFKRIFYLITYFLAKLCIILGRN